MTEILVALVFVALMGIGCLTMRDDDSQTRLQGTVVRKHIEPPYKGGDPTYYLTVEFRDEEGVLNVRTVEATQREWMIWGREGAEVCLRPLSRGDYQMVGCD